MATDTRPVVSAPTLYSQGVYHGQLPRGYTEITLHPSYPTVVGCTSCGNVVFDSEVHDRVCTGRNKLCRECVALVPEDKWDQHQEADAQRHRRYGK